MLKLGLNDIRIETDNGVENETVKVRVVEAELRDINTGPDASTDL